jgi:hypothetical protein
MEVNQAIFSIKLQELSKEYSKLQRYILLYQNSDQEKIRQGIIRLKDESIKNDMQLQNRIDNSRSPTVSKLAAAQVDYNKKVKDILKQDSLDSKESTALYAEYAIDFATQAIYHALLVCLEAMNLQMIEDEKNKKGEDDNE